MWTIRTRRTSCHSEKISSIFATFEPNLAIILSHVIGLLAAFAKEKWPEYEAAINAQAGS
jgi:hypothetical protein